MDEIFIKSGKWVHHNSVFTRKKYDERLNVSCGVIVEIRFFASLYYQNLYNEYEYPFDDINDNTIYIKLKDILTAEESVIPFSLFFNNYDIAELGEYHESRCVLVISDFYDTESMTILKLPKNLLLRKPLYPNGPHRTGSIYYNEYWTDGIYLTDNNSDNTYLNLIESTLDLYETQMAYWLTRDETYINFKYNDIKQLKNTYNFNELNYDEVFKKYGRLI